MTAKLTNDICRCTGDTEIDGEVKVYPARDKCLRYLERETFRGRVYQYPIMTAPTIIDYRGGLWKALKTDGRHSMMNFSFFLR